MPRCTSRIVAAGSLIVAAAAVARSQSQTAWGPYCGVRDSTVHTLPVSREEDRDGAWTVWSKYCRGGFHYHMTPAELVPGDPQFNRVDVPGDGYIIWWPWYMAVTAGPRGPIETREGEQPLSDFLAWFGDPTYYKLAHKLRAPDASRPTTALFVPVWKTGDPKVKILGLTLGASRTAVAAALGEPEDSTLAEGILTLRFPSHEMEVKFAPRSGAIAIAAGRLSNADVLGVHIGSGREDVLSGWGAPQLVRGSMAAYAFDGWNAVLTLDAANEHVQTITIREGAGREVNESLDVQLPGVDCRESMRNDN